MQGKHTVDRRELVCQLTTLGVERGITLVVHTSFRSTGPVEGGPQGLIDALLEAVGTTGTIVMPSMTDWDDNTLFDPANTPCLGLGIVADTFWRLPGVVRSDSPHSFAAAGADAAQITIDHPPDFPHGPDSPIGRAHELDGRVLLLGVGHDANTTVHLAEFYAGVRYRMPKFCTVVQDGKPTRVDYGEIDHCCRNFSLVGDWLAQRGLERVGRVGHAVARLSRSRDIVSTVVEELGTDDLRFLCPPTERCDQCDIARASVQLKQRP